jgi:hypothetical protein
MLDMPITLKLGELVAARPALEKLAMRELPIMAAFKIGVRVRRAADQLDTYDKLKANLIIKLGLQDRENPQKYSINPGDPNWVEYSSKLQELESQDVTLDADPIQLSELGTNAVISVAEIVSLRAFIVE